MAVCANCEQDFVPKPGDSGGYYRFSLERELDSGKTAREQLENLTGSTVTPKGRKKARFLCPQCWNKLKDTARYRHSLDEFFGFTESSSYVAGKRSDSTQASTYIAQSEPSTSKRLAESPGLETVPLSLKRPRFTSTPLKRKSPVARLSFGKSSKSSKWDTIITAIRARQYRRAIFGLFNATKSTKRHFTEVAARITRSEMKQLLAFDLPLCKEVNIPNIANFSWGKIINDFSEKAPLLFNVLKGSVTTKKNEESLMRSSVNLKPRIGTILSLLMHAKAPQKSKFLPTLFSIQLWRGRLKRETIKQLSHLGICLGYEATLSAIDKIRADFDSAALKLKANMETILSQKREENVNELESDLQLALSMSLTHNDTQEETDVDTVLYSDNDDNISYTDCKYQDDKDSSSDSDDSSEAESNSSFFDLNDSEESDQEDIEMDEEIETVHESMELSDMTMETSSMENNLARNPIETEQLPEVPGYCMCWDNVGKKVVTRHPTENIKNRYMNMALGYMAVNRVKCMRIDQNAHEVINAQDLKIDTFVPSQKDVDQLRSRMNVIVGRVITRHMKWFNEHFEEYSIPHIVHEYSLQSTWRSVPVNLGVFDEDPCSTQGAIGIYEKLQKYVPTIDGVPHKTLVYGDGLSCERGNDAQRARANGLNPMERLQGLEPAAQEFHKEMLVLQDFYDEFFKGASASDRGTLCQLKNLFNFRQVKADISDNFSHAWELMCLVVEGFTCLLTMQVAGMNDIAERPSNAPADIESADCSDKRAFLEKTINTVVDKVWQTLRHRSSAQ